MNKFLLVATLFVFTIMKSMAGVSDLFHYEDVSVENQLSGLSTLESLINNNTDGFNTNSIEILSTELSLQKILFKDDGSDDLIGIPPFLYGCVLGPIGILIVYALTDHNKQLVRKSVIGCAVGYGGGLVVYIFILVISIATIGI